MGQPAQPLDSQGREKVKCALCGLYYHRVDKHVFERHGVGAKEYIAKFPGFELMSAAVVYKLRAGGGTEVVEDEAENDALKFGVARLRIRQLDKTDEIYVPTHDELWVPGESAADTANLEYLALGAQDDENVLLVGPPGVGKTTLVRQLAAICNQPLRRLPFHGELRVSDLIGSKELVVDPQSGQTITRWVNGPLPEAAVRGQWVLFDEFDSAPPQTTFLLHSLMEHPRQLTLMGDGGGEVKFHDEFRVFATANTLGYGDDTGLFAGTGPMNESLLDRFGTVIRFGYPAPETEIAILIGRSNIQYSVASKMVDVANKIREAQRTHAAMVSLSPRRLVAWATKAVRLRSVQRAAKVTILNKLPPDDAAYVSGVIQRHFGHDGRIET